MKTLETYTEFVRSTSVVWVRRDYSMFFSSQYLFFFYSACRHSPREFKNGIWWWEWSGIRNIFRRGSVTHWSVSPYQDTSPHINGGKIFSCFTCYIKINMAESHIQILVTHLLKLNFSGKCKSSVLKLCLWGCQIFLESTPLSLNASPWH